MTDATELSRGRERTVRVEVGCVPGGSDNEGDGSANLFEPSTRTPPPRRPPPNAATGAADAPEKKLTVLALRLAVLEKCVSRLGALSFVWATVVLLGGFAVVLRRQDFWFVTVVLVMEGARVFTRTSELEWHHQSTWTVAAAGRSSSRFVVRAVRGIFSPTARNSAFRPGRSVHVEATRRTQPDSGRLFVVANLQWLLMWLQLGSAITCVTLSLIRLAAQDYGLAGTATSNGNPAINLFYGLALSESLLFLLERAYWAWEMSVEKLLDDVSRRSGLGTAGVPAVRRFFYDAYAKCISGSVFDGLKMDLVTFAEELLESGAHDEQMMGALILRSFAASEQFAEATLQKLGTSERATRRLLEMLSWKSPWKQGVRVFAAEIMSTLTGRAQHAMRVAALPGASESVSSLLRTDGSAAKDAMDDDHSGHGHTSVLNLCGLQILKHLSSDPDNCGKIGDAPGLLAKVICFTGAGDLLLLQTAPPAEIEVVKRALEVVRTLARTKGRNGNALRRAISEDVFAASNLRAVLERGEGHEELQALAIEVLASLSMDDAATESIGATGGMLPLLLGIFFRASVPGGASPSGEAGEALTMLTLKSEANCARLLREEGVLAGLVGALEHPLLRLHAARILRNLCAYSEAESFVRLRDVTTAIPTVLKAVMNDREKLLEVSIGLLTEACKFLGPSEFAGDLKKAGIEEMDFLQKLISVLKEHKYPEIKVPRMRRFVIQQATWMMESERRYLELFKKLQMKQLLESVANTTSELENYHVFSGSVGISRHRQTMSSLVDMALQQLGNGLGQESI